MTLDEGVRQQYRRAVAELDRVPDGLYTDLDGASIRIQTATQEDVRRVRAAFPGVFWSKEHNASCDWWEYRTTFNAVPIRIYAVHEAPPTCRATEVVETVEELVPVHFEKRLVEKRRLVWDCSGDA